MGRVAALVLSLSLSAACGGGERGVEVYFDLSGDLAEPARYFDHPFPSDLRLTVEGTPDLEGYPNPKGIPIIEDLLEVAAERPGFPVMPVAYFRFDGPLSPRVPEELIPGSTDAPILLFDLDAGEPALVPTVAVTLVAEEWAPAYLLAVAPRPGYVLAGGHRHAVVIRRSLGDAKGAPLAVATPMRRLAAGETPEGALGEEAAQLFAPLWPALESLGVEPGEVAAATVFTTGDVVADLAGLAEAVAGSHEVAIEGLALDPDDGAGHERFCELLATVSLPQFQAGAPPFNSGGRFDLGADGLPIEQRREAAAVVVAIPRAPMPAAGYPLMLYFHGSGGVPAEMVDRGRIDAPGGAPAPGEGPAHVVAAHEIASAASALPLSPDRLPSAGPYEYLNFNNLAAFRDTFRQGVLEQRLLLDALLALEVSPDALSACPGPELPAGAASFRFDPGRVVVSGQSMGGLYSNLFGAVEPRVRAAVPTGAGGFWNLMILETQVFPGVRDTLAAALGTPAPELTFAHPGLHLIGLGWEAAEPLVYMPRLGRRPLEGHPVRPVYQPVGRDDSYFSTSIYDAAALAYGHRQAGEVVWPAMQEALALAGLDGLVDYPASREVTSESGEPYTGVVVQYEADPVSGDGHYIFAQREEVKHQYGCFLATFLDGGPAIVPAPAEPGAPCR